GASPRSSARACSSPRSPSAQRSRRRRGCWRTPAVSPRERNVPTYTVNRAGLTHAKELIDARQYRVRSRWNEVQPRARDQNAFLKTHSWGEYAAWHLGLTEGATDETKARYAFVFGDFRRVHRMGVISCLYRAAEWDHKEIERAAYDLLQYLDRARGMR